MEPDDCPVVCTRNAKKRIDINRTELCDKCPRRTKKRDFERNTLRLWEEWMPDECGDLKFQDFVTELYTARELRERKELITRRYGLMIGIYDEESDRYDRINRAASAV